MGEDEIIVRQVASASEGETRALGLKIASLLRPGDIILLIGELGTGKTVLAKGVARGLGVKENILSPTFTLLKEYAGKVPLYHLDAYRLHGAGDLYELGLEEYLEEASCWSNGGTGCMSSLRRSSSRSEWILPAMNRGLFGLSRQVAIGDGGCGRWTWEAI